MGDIPGGHTRERESLFDPIKPAPHRGQVAAVVFKQIHTANVQIDAAEYREYLGESPVCVLS